MKEWKEIASEERQRKKGCIPYKGESFIRIGTEVKWIEFTKPKRKFSRQSGFVAAADLS